MISSRWFCRKWSCPINTDLQRRMQCNCYWTGRPSDRQNSKYKIKLQTLISNIFEWKVKSCNTRKALFHNSICTSRRNLERKHKSSYSRQSVVLQGQNEKVLYSIKLPYVEIIFFTTRLSCISDPAGYWTHIYVKTKDLFLQTGHNDKHLIFRQTDENFLRTEKFSSFRERTLAILSK